MWNCPRLSEIPKPAAHRNGELIVYYHGSITGARLPPSLIRAVSRFGGAVRLHVAGFEVPGAIGYVQEMLTLAEDSGVADLIKFLGTIPLRRDLFHTASMADVGLSFMPTAADDVNLRHMVGASNKPFDYMACGLPLLVSDLPDWSSTFVEPGFARACDPNDPDSIEATLRWYLDRPVDRRAMGRRCRKKIRQDWNYDVMFAGVLAEIETVSN